MGGEKEVSQDWDQRMRQGRDGKVGRKRFHRTGIRE